MRRDRWAAATGAVFVVALSVGNVLETTGQSNVQTGQQVLNELHPRSPKTVRNHVSHIVTKLQVADRAQAIVLARDAGLGR